MPYKVFFPVHHVARAILLISLHSATLVIAAAQDPPKPQEKPKSEEEVKKEATEKVQKDLTNAQGKRIPAVTPSADQNPSNLSTGSRGLQGQDVPIIRVRQAEARQAETRGDWNEAFALHKQAIDIAKQENNKEAIADASLRYARA